MVHIPTCSFFLVHLKVVGVCALLVRKMLSVVGGHSCEAGPARSAETARYVIRRGIQDVGALDVDPPFHEGVGLKVVKAGQRNISERLRDVNLRSIRRRGRGRRCARELEEGMRSHATPVGEGFGWKR